MKTCRKCKVCKSSTDFYKASRNSDGLQSYCKDSVETLQAAISYIQEYS